MKLWHVLLIIAIFVLLVRCNQPTIEDPLEPVDPCPVPTEDLDGSGRVDWRDQDWNTVSYDCWCKWFCN